MNRVHSFRIFLSVAYILCVGACYAQFDASDYRMIANDFRQSSDNKELSLNINQFYNNLTRSDKHTIVLPNLNGEFSRYALEETHVVSDQVADSYTIKTYAGYNLDNPSKVVVCDVTRDAFHAVVYDEDQYYALEPKKESTRYSLAPIGIEEIMEISCGVDGDHLVRPFHADHTALRSPDQKTTYEIAFSVSGEYNEEFGGDNYNVLNVLNNIASGVNMMNQVYKRDMGVEFIIVSDEQSIYPNADTDPFDYNDLNSIINQNTTLLNNIYGSDAYDVGHVLVWANKGGLAYVNSLCNPSIKGGGVTSIIGSMNKFWLKYVAHEVGHQLGSRHKFTASECLNSAQNNRYEPGAGTSIMSYNGLCLGPGAPPNFFFHYSSIDQMQTYISSQSCGVHSYGNDEAPQIDTIYDVTIPKGTPFYLVGNATDNFHGSSTQSRNNNITYNWIQYDGNGPATSGEPDCNSTVDPLFMYSAPRSEGYRHFPDYDYAVAGMNDVTYEQLPCVARDLHFKLVARDNDYHFGRLATRDVEVTVANTGPFEIIAPNGSESFSANETVTVSWSVNGTDSHCSAVDILYSSDNGTSFEMLSAATNNDGSETINIPVDATEYGRIIVQCATGGFRTESTFYDITDAPFRVQGVLPVVFDYIKGEFLKTYNRVYWATATEENSDYFEIEKLIDDEWTTIGTVAAGEYEYEFLDDDIYHGDHFYRLKSVDLDKSKSYSDFIKIYRSEEDEKVVLYPIPFDHEIKIKGIDHHARYSIINSEGRLLKVGSVKNNRIATEELASGLYYIVIHDRGKDHHYKVNK